LHFASHASFQYLAGRRNKNNTNHYNPSNDIEIVDDVQTTAQEKLEYLFLTMAGSGLTSALKEKVTS
jgi:hypothetical protein